MVLSIIVFPVTKADTGDAERADLGQKIMQLLKQQKAAPTKMQRLKQQKIMQLLKMEPTKPEMEPKMEPNMEPKRSGVTILKVPPAPKKMPPMAKKLPVKKKAPEVEQKVEPKRSVVQKVEPNVEPNMSVVQKVQKVEPKVEPKMSVVQKVQKVEPNVEPKMSVVQKVEPKMDAMDGGSKKRKLVALVASPKWGRGDAAVAKANKNVPQMKGTVAMSPTLADAGLRLNIIFNMLNIL